jgi:hypothetical protein
MRTLIRRGLTVLAVVALHGSSAAAQSPPAPVPPPVATAPSDAAPEPKAEASDLDLLMKDVLANRDQSWRRLQEYLLAERESFRLLGPGGGTMFGSVREYLWVARDGRAVRSPVKVNGVAVSDGERRRREEQWQRDEDDRAARAEKRRQETPETTADVEAALKDGEPRFVSEVQFLRFKFEPGNYFLAGRETVAGRPVLRIEYYPQRLFDEKSDERRREREHDRDEAAAKGRRREVSIDDDERIERAFNKVSLVTLWVDPTLKQILRYTFDNVDFGFLPGRSLVRVEQARATMSMGQPFEGIWFPESLSVEGAVTLAAGTFRAEYRRRFQDYRQADVQVRFRVKDDDK